jgi:hypothetical protein
MAGELRSCSPEPEENTNSYCHTSLREELAKKLLLKDRKKKKTGKTPHHLARLRQSLCLNTNTRTGC